MGALQPSELPGDCALSLTAVIVALETLTNELEQDIIWRLVQSQNGRRLNRTRAVHARGWSCTPHLHARFRPRDLSNRSRGRRNVCRCPGPRYCASSVGVAENQDSGG